MEKEFNCLWACSRPMGKYRGIYPGGFINRLNEIIPLDNIMILHQFGGTTKQNIYNHTVDINPDVKPTYHADARDLHMIESDINPHQPQKIHSNINYRYPGGRSNKHNPERQL